MTAKDGLGLIGVGDNLIEFVTFASIEQTREADTRVRLLPYTGDGFQVSVCMW